MCGIVGYVGKRKVVPVLIKGLHRLEYRGYDSAGIAVVTPDRHMYVWKQKGKVADLERRVLRESGKVVAHTGIGHTRWATHGIPSDINAHPHVSQSGRFALVHNGIIENHDSLRKILERRGYTFQSDTDTEVLVQLIDALVNLEHVEVEEAFKEALRRVVGAYAVVLLDKENPDVLYAARKSSPLVVGIGEEETLIASDATPLLEYTRKVIFLEDDEIVRVTREGEIQVVNLQDGALKTPTIQHIDWELDQVEKGGYPHFMLKEIFEQPESIKNAMRGRMNAAEGWIKLGGIQMYLDRLLNAPRIILVGCGTSWHACLVGEYLFEDLARIPAEVEYASEFRYRNPLINPEDVVIAISQSGETADTRFALLDAKKDANFGWVNQTGDENHLALHIKGIPHKH